MLGDGSAIAAVLLYEANPRGAAPATTTEPSDGNRPLGGDSAATRPDRGGAADGAAGREATVSPSQRQGRHTHTGHPSTHTWEEDEDGKERS